MCREVRRRVRREGLWGGNGDVVAATVVVVVIGEMEGGGEEEDACEVWKVKEGGAAAAISSSSKPAAEGLREEDVRVVVEVLVMYVSTRCSCVFVCLKKNMMKSGKRKRGEHTSP
jgi:hypothetical protein